MFGFRIDARRIDFAAASLNRWRRRQYAPAALAIAAAATLSAAAAPSQPAAATPNPAPNFSGIGPVALGFRNGDVVAFVGGADVVGEERTGHLEALLDARFQRLRLRFRNFGWEGDTVYAQPRDFNFPPLLDHLRQAHATVTILQFGRMESLAGPDRLAEFVAAYEKLLRNFAKQTPRFVLVTPLPFEPARGLWPDLSRRNRDLARYCQAIRTIGRTEKIPVIDLFDELGGLTVHRQNLTEDGLQLTPRGQALVAAAFARQAGFGQLAAKAGPPAADGSWPDRRFEALRRAVAEKDRLWFDYWRPENWAFLGGDRTDQPSSRDYRNPSIRWFPAEMKQYVPLIATQEEKIFALAGEVSKGAR